MFKTLVTPVNLQNMYFFIEVNLEQHEKISSTVYNSPNKIMLHNTYRFFHFENVSKNTNSNISNSKNALIKPQEKSKKNCESYFLKLLRKQV